jgi:rod shape-determining protein MreC
MRAILLLIQQYRVFLSFIGLEVFCFWLVVNNNSYQQAVFFSSANQYVGSLLTWSTSIREYFYLSKINKDLATENARLNQQLLLKQLSNTGKGTSISDPNLANRFEFISARVVNNSTSLANNHITIDKGRLAGIQPGMGVISPNGVVGKVKTVSNHFAIITSVLHSKVGVSAQLKKNNELGIIKWDGVSPEFAKLADVPAYVKVQPGDTVVASGFNAIFPPKAMIGKIHQVKNNEIIVRLSTNFNSLSYVYVIKNIFKVEQDSLEIETFKEIDE